MAGPRWPPASTSALASDWLLRRHRLRTRHRLARGRLARFAAVPECRPGRNDAGSFDPVAHPAADRRGNAPQGIPLGAGIAGRPRFAQSKSKRIGIDATTLEANAAMRSIIRRDTGESYEVFLTGLAKESGIETPTREDLARMDRKRKKKTSNKDWVNPHDRDARVAKMKDGRTHLAHKGRTRGGPRQRRGDRGHTARGGQRRYHDGNGDAGGSGRNGRRSGVAPKPTMPPPRSPR